MATVAPSAFAPHIRPRREPHSTTTSDVNRDSNALRASVLETALEIGFGSNTTVANWIFNNPLTEEEEPDETPELTYASTEESDATRSPHTSAGADPTSLAPFSAPVSFPSSESDMTINTNVSPFEGPHSTPGIHYPNGFNPFDRSFSATPTKDGGQFPNKLRKSQRKIGDEGYESEGYLSEGGKKKKEKSMRKKDIKKEKSTKKKRGKDDAKDFSGETEFKREPTLDTAPEAVFESLPKVKFTKSKSIKSVTSTPKKSKSSTPSSVSPPPSPSLSPKRVKASKSLSFFRLTHKQSKEKLNETPEEKEKETPPPVPSMPAPIFERFARTASPMPGAAPSIMSVGTATAVSPTSETERKSQESTGSGMGAKSLFGPKLALDFYGDGASTITAGSITTSTTVTTTVPSKDRLSIATSQNSSKSLSPTPSSDRSLTPSYVIVTPATSSVNLPSDPAANPSSSRNPLQKLMKNIPAPLSISSHPPPGPTYAISHPNTNPNSRDQSPAPLSNTSYQLVSHPYSAGAETKPNTLAPPRPIRRRSLLSIVPSPDITDNEGMPPPTNVLAYYDIPPPSPPPTCPLPRVPKHPNFSQPPPSSQRGKMSPFPSKPILPDHVRPGADGDPAGFEERAKIRRYGELYALSQEERPATGPRSFSDIGHGSRDESRRNVCVDEVRQARRRGGFIEHMSPQISAEDDAGDNEEDGDDSLDNILSRYSEFGHQNNDDSDDESHYAPTDGDSIMYQAGRSTISLDRPSFDLRPSMDVDDEDRGNGHYGRYAESVHSIMDDEKSGAARDRFVRRVQALYGSDGREQNEVPPVPKLPEGLRTRGLGRGAGWI